MVLIVVIWSGSKDVPGGFTRSTRARTSGEERCQGASLSSHHQAHGGRLHRRLPDRGRCG